MKRKGSLQKKTIETTNASCPRTFSRRQFVLTGAVAAAPFAIMPRHVPGGSGFVDTEKFEPTWSSLRHHNTPQWLFDAKFGIYTHLTLQSVKNIPGNEKKMLHELIPEFKLKNFDAAAWADLFQKSGARFAGPVSWHGSGFLHWDSDVTRFNSVDMGPGIDIVGSLKKTIKARNMKFITSFHPGYWYEAVLRGDNPEYRNPKYTDLYGPVHDTNVTDAIPWKNHIEKQSKFNREFLNSFLARMKEVVTKYQPDIVWFDDVFGGTLRGLNAGLYKNGKLISSDDIYLSGICESYQRDFIAHFYNTGLAYNQEVELVYKEHDVPPGIGMRDLENGLIDELAYDVWMTDIDICDPVRWIYKEGMGIKSANTIINILVDVISKNGVLLLNVPPKPDGAFADFITKELFEIGDWLKINGEAIYGTMPWSIFGEGPTILKKVGHYSEGNPNAIFTEKDIRFTEKGNTLYAICLGWPGKEVTIRSLGTRGRLYEGDILSVELLGSQEKLQYDHLPYGLTIQLPMNPIDRKAIVFKIERIK